MRLLTASHAGLVTLITGLAILLTPILLCCVQTARSDLSAVAWPTAGHPGSKVYIAGGCNAQQPCPQFAFDANNEIVQGDPSTSIRRIDIVGQRDLLFVHDFNNLLTLFAVM